MWSAKVILGKEKESKKGEYEYLSECEMEGVRIT